MGLSFPGEILHDLREREVRLFALSNWSAETYAIARRLVPELGLFDDVLISGEVRRTKPDPELFEIAVQRFRIDPARAFFVDDVPPNVEGGRLFGFTAIQFTSAAALRESLAALGVL